MYGLEHGVSLSEVGAPGCPHSALNLRCLVGYYIAVEVREDEHAEAAPPCGVYELCGHYIDEPVIPSDAGVLLGDLFGDAQELPVGGLYDVCLCYQRDVVNAVLFGVFESRADDPFGSLGGCDAEVHRQVIRHVYSVASQGVAAFGVLPEERPVYAKLGDGHGPHVCEQVELLPHSHVCALDIGPRISLFGGGRRPFKYDVAFLQLRQRVVGYGLHDLYAPLDGQPVYLADLYISGPYLVGEKELHDPLG